MSNLARYLRTVLRHHLPGWAVYWAILATLGDPSSLFAAWPAFVLSDVLAEMLCLFSDLDKKGNKSCTAPCRHYYSNSHSLAVLLGQLHLFNPPDLRLLNISVLHSSTLFFIKSGCCVILGQITDRNLTLWWSTSTKLLLSSALNTEPQARQGFPH